MLLSDIFHAYHKKKQKSEIRNSREADVLSDVEDMDIMLDTNLFEREESELSNSVRRPESPTYTTLVNNESISHSN